jgi:hypothetical protein
MVLAGDLYSPTRVGSRTRSLQAMSMPGTERPSLPEMRVRYRRSGGSSAHGSVLYRELAVVLAGRTNSIYLIFGGTQVPKNKY